MAAADYQFFVRNLKTLAFVDELRPQDVIGNWTRRQYAGGKFELTLPLDAVTPAGVTRYPPSTLEGHHLLEVRRNGSREYLGVIERNRVGPLGKRRIISGPDLTSYWLTQRIVGEDNKDDRTGVAETVLLAYIAAYLGASAATARKVVTYLTGLTWTTATTAGRGLTVNAAGTRKNLLLLMQEICEAGEIIAAVDIDDGYTGYTFSVTEPADHTTATGSLPFAVDWDNIEELEFDEDYSEYRNHVIVAGDGTGDARNITEVEDASSITTHMRREVVVDARYATTADQRTTVGNFELAKRNRQIVKVKAKPYRASANAVYREDWDVGWDITFKESRLRSDPVDCRVVAATVSIGGTGTQPYEDFQYELGEHASDSDLRRLAEAITQLRVSSNV